MRKATLPQKSDDYPLELPKDFKAPEGVTFEVKADDPLWSQGREWALKHGLSKEAFQEGIALVAGDRIGTQQRIMTARNAEIAKLGPAGTALVTANNTWLDAMGVPGLKARMFTAQDVNDVAALITKFSRQGGAPFTTSGREPPQPAGRVSQEVFDKMTPAARIDYARQFDQSKFNGAPQR